MSSRVQLSKSCIGTDVAIQDASVALKRPSSCTEFQVHAQLGPNVIDFTERRLLRCAFSASSSRQRLLLVALTHDYLEGRTAVAWRRGRCVPLRIDPEIKES